MTHLVPEFEILGRFAADVSFDASPASARRATRELLLDTLGVAIGASTTPEIARLAQRLDRGPGAPAGVIGRPERTGELAAAMLAGIATTWLDFDSGHRHPPGTPLLPAHHPAAHLVPTIVALADTGDRTVEEALGAILAGFEVAARLSVAVRVRESVHPHGGVGTVGAAVAAARLLGIDAEGIARSIGLAAGLALQPPFSSATGGSTVRNAYAGHGAATGILAARLARSGFTSERAVLTTVFGGVISSSVDRTALVAGLGAEFEIERGFFKPFPACRYAHPAIEAAARLNDGTPLSADDIEAVEVRTYALAATLTERAPRTELAAKFSIPHAVASMLVRGSAGVLDFRAGHGLADDAVTSVSARTSVVEEPAMTAVAPGMRPAQVAVTMRDGSTRSATVERSGGGPDAPWTTADVLAKYRSLAAERLGAARAEELATAVLEAGPEVPLGALAALTVPQPR